MDGVYLSDKRSVFNSNFSPNLLDWRAFCHEKAAGAGIFDRFSS